MKATPLMLITGPSELPDIPWAECSNAPMMPTPLTLTVASSGTVISHPPRIATTWMETSRSENRASRRSISPPPRSMNALKVFGTTQSPLREKPPRMATAVCDVGSPPYWRTSPAAGRDGAGTDAAPLWSGRSWVIGTSSA